MQATRFAEIPNDVLKLYAHLKNLEGKKVNRETAQYLNNLKNKINTGYEKINENTNEINRAAYYQKPTVYARRLQNVCRKYFDTNHLKISLETIFKAWEDPTNFELELNIRNAEDIQFAKIFMGDRKLTMQAWAGIKIENLKLPNNAMGEVVIQPNNMGHIFNEETLKNSPPKMLLDHDKFNHTSAYAWSGNLGLWSPLDELREVIPDKDGTHAALVLNEPFNTLNYKLFETMLSFYDEQTRDR